jgi:RimJ/RimL family protein N-acetyltransferase
MISIRRFEENDWLAVWRFMEPVFRAGDTYAFSPDISEKEAYRIWVELPHATYVAVDDNKAILGTYYIKPNQPSQGAHVCNCGYIVSEKARGQGIASRMCDHSQQEALDKGFLAMQFNLVVSTNEGAVRLWEKLGFSVLGTLPKAFNHPLHGFVDALIMYKWLSA